jgi:peroxiredoxin
MTQEKQNIPFEIAPDFTLTDTNDHQVRLSEFRGDKFVVLTFLRGFV